MSTADASTFFESQALKDLQSKGLPAYSKRATSTLARSSGIASSTVSQPSGQAVSTSMVPEPQTVKPPPISTTDWQAPDTNSDMTFAANPKASGMNIVSRLFALEEMVVREIKSLKKQMEAVKTSTAHMNSNSAANSSQPFFGEEDAATSVKGKRNVELDLSTKEEADKLNPSLSANAPRNESTTTLQPPLYIRNLPLPKFTQLSTRPIPLQSMHTFSRSFITTFFGGSEWSPGFYSGADNHTSLLADPPATPSPSSKTKIKHKDTYYVLHAAANPFLPHTPGEHGAALTLFFHDFDDAGDRYANVPLFATAPPGTGTALHSPVSTTFSRQHHAEGEEEEQFVYMGNYTQSRWSDRLDHERTALVPLAVKQHWARLLVSSHRPEWLAEAVMRHFWPKPSYEGRIGGPSAEGGDEAEMEDVNEDIADFVEEVRGWRVDAREKLEGLTEGDVMGAFERVSPSFLAGLMAGWRTGEAGAVV